jgi:AcrR family transcriptional regulator
MKNGLLILEPLIGAAATGYYPRSRSPPRPANKLSSYVLTEASTKREAVNLTPLGSLLITQVFVKTRRAVGVERGSSGVGSVFRLGDIMQDTAETAAEATSTPSPSPVRGSQLRQRLVDCGLALIEGESAGEAGLSLREVARASGVSHMAPYVFFQSKNDLLSAIAAAGFRMLLGDLEAAVLRAGASPRARLIALGLAYIDFGLARPQLIRLMFGGRIPISERSEELRQIHGQGFMATVAIIEAGMKCGEFRQGDAFVAAFSGWSLLQGFSQLVLGGELQEKIGASQLSVRTSAQKVIETFLNGLDA